MMFFKKQKPKKIHAEAAAVIRASAEGPAKFSASPAYDGGAIFVAGYEFAVVVDLQGLEVHRKVIANLDHQASKRVGQIINARNDGKTLSLEGVLSAATPFRDEVLASHKDGFSWDVSVEVNPVKLEMIEAGKSVAVNGREIDGPIYVARKSVLTGLAFVGIGADANNRVAIAAMAGLNEPELAEAEPETPEATDDFDAWLVKHGFDITTLNEQQIQALKEIFDEEEGEEIADGEPGVMEASYRALNINAAFARADTSIEDICIKYESECVQHEGRYLAGLTPEKIEGIKLRAQKRLEGLKTRAINASYSRAQFQSESTRITNNLRLELIRASRPVGPSIHSSNRDLHMDQKVIEAAIHIRTGNEELALKKLGERTTEAARKAGPRTFIDICKSALQARGATTPHDTNEMIKAAFSHTDLPNILKNVTGRTLEKAYLETTDSWRSFVAEKSAADFKLQQSIRPSSAENLEEIGADGEIVHNTIKEEDTYNWSIGTYAKMETITRKDIINDDLSFFDERPTMMGISAGRTLNDLLWRTIMSATFSNSLTLALSIDNLVSAVAKMKTQKDSQGNSIDMAPVTLAVPPELEGAARQILRSTEVLNVTAGGLVGNANPAYNIVPNLAVEPRLSNSKFTNWAIDNWFLFGGPITSAVIVGFLDGRQTPIIETQEAAFNTLGMSLRCYHDFGVAMGDGKASLKSNPA